MRIFETKSLWFFLFLVSSIINFILLYFLWNQHSYRADQINLPAKTDTNKESVAYKPLTTKKQIFEPSTSVVYIKPHPPDFLKGRSMKIQRFDKSIINGKEIWRLEEITEDNKVKIWNIDSNSIEW